MENDEQTDRCARALPEQALCVVHIDRQHKPHADIQHQHRAAARRIEGQGNADDRQYPQVHAYIHGDLSHQGAADAGADIAAQQVPASRTGGKGLDHQCQQCPQHDAQANKANGIAHPAENKVVVGIGHAVVPAAEQAVAEDAAGAQRDLAALLLVDDVLPHGLAGGPGR